MLTNRGPNPIVQDLVYTQNKNRPYSKKLVILSVRSVEQMESTNAGRKALGNWKCETIKVYLISTNWRAHAA